MLITMLKAKIHRAAVTEANLNYVGSITIDRTLLDAAGIFEYEQVHVLDINNGQRFETYVIAGPPDSGTICLNGAAARLVQVGDKVIIIAYCQIDAAAVINHQPQVVFVDELNRLTKTGGLKKDY